MPQGHVVQDGGTVNTGVNGLGGSPWPSSRMKLAFTYPGDVTVIIVFYWENELG